MRFSIFTILACIITSIAAAPQSSSHPLERRKGGGGGGRGGGGGSSSGGSRGGSSGSGRSSSDPRYSGYSFSPSSNAGGQTRDGSGTPKAYGNYYTGGASVPYTAGRVSPTKRLAPFALPVAAVAFFPAIWLFPVWAYPYSLGYHWIDNGRNLTSNVTCLCQEYSVCGCDPTDNSTLLTTVVTDGGSGGAPVNSTNVRTVDWGNGTIATYINGTLDNGTTASGGADPSNPDQVSPAAKLVVDYAGYWVMIATVVASVTIL